MARTWPRPDATVPGRSTSAAAQAAWPGPHFERDVPEAVRPIGPDRAGTERRWPGPGRGWTRRLPARSTSAAAQAARPGPRFERDVPEAVRSIGQTRAGAERRWPGPGRARMRRRARSSPALWRKLPGQARASSATCPRPSAPSARPEPALRDDGQDLAASGRNGARSVHQRCGASCLARPAVRARRAPGRSLHRPGHSRR